MKTFVLAIFVSLIAPSAMGNPAHARLLNDAQKIVVQSNELLHATEDFASGYARKADMLRQLKKLENLMDKFRLKASGGGIVFTPDVMVQGRTGHLIASYDDFRGGVAGISISNSIDRICKMAGFPGGQGGELEGFNFGCAMESAPTVYCSNGNCSFAGKFVANGNGWCSSTAIEWVACRDGLSVIGTRN